MVSCTSAGDGTAPRRLRPGYANCDGQSFSADRRRDSGALVPGVRAMVRYNVHGGLAPPVPCGRGGVRASSHSAYQLARWGQVRGGLAWVSAAMATPGRRGQRASADTPCGGHVIEAILPGAVT